MNRDDNGTNNLNVSWDINLKKKKMDLGRGERKEKEKKEKTKFCHVATVRRPTF